MNDPVLDAAISEHFRDEPLSDEDFTQAVERRIARHWRRRRWALGTAGLGSSMVALVVILQAAGPAIAQPQMDLAGAISTLILTSACGLTFVATTGANR
jgi:hypothetical protein